MGLGPLRSRRKLFALRLPFGLFTVGFAMICSLLAAPSPASAAAGINQQINFQGRMYTAAGATIPDGTYNLQFKIYQDGDGLTAGDTTGSPAGSLKWTENWLVSASHGVAIKNGFLSVQLGSVNAFGSSVDWNQDTLWLSLQIGNTSSCAITTTFQSDCGGDGEMVPMKRMSANAYALNALNANLLGGLSSAGFVQNTTSAALQTGTSLAIQSAADTNVTAYLQGRTSQSAAVLSIKGGSSQSGDYLRIVDSANAVKFNIDSSGNSTLSGSQSIAGALGVGVAATSGVQLKVTPANSTTIALQVAGSGTASGTNIVQVDGNNGGGIAYNGAGTATTTSGTAQTTATGIYKSANTSGTQTDGLVVDRNGAGGTTTNGLTISQTAGTLTNGLAFSGTIGTDINRSSGTLSINGAGGIDLKTGGTTTASLSSTGAALFKNASSNSSAAFQIQNTSGYSLLNVDTSMGFVINNGMSSTSGNLIQNGSFEGGGTANGTSGWYTNSSWNVVTGSSNAHSGNRYYANTAQSNFTPNTVGWVSVQPGEQYYAETYFKIATGTDGTASLRLTWIDKDQSGVVGTTTTACTPATTSYALCAVRGTAPATSQYLGLTYVVASRTTGTYYFDDAYMTRVNHQAPVILQNAIDSTTAFQVINSGGNQLLTVDTSGNQVILGKAGASGVSGKLVLQNATNANTVTLLSGTTSSSYTLTLPTALGGSGDCLKDTTGGGVLGFVSCGGSGVTTVGAFSGTSIANGASISGNTITFGPADGTNPGMVTTGTQTFGGDKTIGGVLLLQDGTNSAPGFGFASQPGLGVYRSAANIMDLVTPSGSVRIRVGTVNKVQFDTAGIKVANTCYNYSTNGSDASGPVDTGFCRDGAGAVGMRSGTTAQTLGIYNTYTNATNYESATLGFAGNVFGIDTQAAGTGTIRAISIGGANATTITLGATSGTPTQQLNIGTNNTSGSTTNVTIGAGGTATGGTTTIQSKGNTTLNTNGTLRATFDTSNGLYLGNGVTNASPSNFLISAAGSSTTAVTGGTLSIQGGNATVGNANGGNLNLTGGAGVGTGVTGLVVIGTPTFTTSLTDSGCYISGVLASTSCTISSASVNGSAAVIVGFNQVGQTATLPDPTILTAGRILYVTAANGSSDFSLSVNGGGTGNIIAMRQNTSATMVWNGTDWTAAGASSSTTLQSAYDNTLQTAGGAELIVSKTSTTNGLTIRDALVNSVNGTLLSVQTSSAANLFSVNSNVTDYATDGGAETAGASSSAFPANTWSALTGSTVTRYTTAGNFIPTGQASVSVVTTAVANTGVANKLSTTLTANMIYNVSFATRLSSGTFTDMNVYYSVDGTTASTVCTTTQAVTTSVQTKVNCAFTAPSSGITSSNAILIRQTAGTTRTFYVDNLSVTIAADYNYATDGSVTDSTNFATNWSSVASATVTRSTSVGNDASNSAQVVATSIGQGVRTKLSINPLTSTVYRISVYVSSNTAGFSGFTIRYSRDGGTNFASCTDYNTQTVSSTITDFTKITCYVTTDSTTATSPYVYFTQSDAVSRTFYVDTFAMTLSTNTTPNVQIGGGINGGPVTLFTLDRAAAAPIATNNDALLGSMYYDTTLGKLQCYEADGWGACGSSPDNIVTISPEYTNAVMHGTGVGTMTSDICSDPLNINDGSSGQSTICGTNETFNFYKWTSPQPTTQTYSIYVTYQLPGTFKAFASGQTSVMGRTDSTNSTVQVTIYRNNSVTGLTACGSAVSVSTGVQTAWQVKTATGAADPSTCSFAANDSIVFKIDMISNSNANAYLSNLNFTYSNK